MTHWKSDIKNWCTSCGDYMRMVTYTSTEKDVHGHVLREGSWTTCEGCGMTLMESPWQINVCPAEAT